jgi:hypothetical protein
MSKLEELKAAYEAASPGEWKAPGFNSQGGKVACLIGPDELRLVSGNFKRGDAHFIALAHNMMPQLLEAVELLKQSLPIIDAYRRAMGGDGDITAMNIRALLDKLK